MSEAKFRLQLVFLHPVCRLEVQLSSPAPTRHAILASLASSPPNQRLGSRMVFTASQRAALNAARTSLRPGEQQAQRGAGSWAALLMGFGLHFWFFHLLWFDGRSKAHLQLRSNVTSCHRFSKSKGSGSQGSLERVFVGGGKRLYHTSITEFPICCVVKYGERSLPRTHHHGRTSLPLI